MFVGSAVIGTVPLQMYHRVMPDVRKLPRLQLVAVVCYYGKHYSTFVFHSKLKTWIYFDDATVREVSGLVGLHACLPVLSVRLIFTGRTNDSFHSRSEQCTIPSPTPQPTQKCVVISDWRSCTGWLLSLTGMPQCVTPFLGPLVKLLCTYWSHHRR